MDNKRRMDRREFIKGVSLAGLGLAVGPALLDLSARQIEEEVNWVRLRL